MQIAFCKDSVRNFQFSLLINREPVLRIRDTVLFLIPGSGSGIPEWVKILTRDKDPESFFWELRNYFYWVKTYFCKFCCGFGSGNRCLLDPWWTSGSETLQTAARKARLCLDYKIPYKGEMLTNRILSAWYDNASLSSAEPEILNFQGAQKSIQRNRFPQPV
jgi:hypothetical protein